MTLQNKGTPEAAEGQAETPTPLPWSIEWMNKRVPSSLRGNNTTDFVAGLNSCKAQDADLIVRAVNAHEALTTEVAKLREASMAFAKAWAAWHENSQSWLDGEVIDAGHGIVASLGLEMVEGKKGKQKLVPVVAAREEGA